MRILVAGTYDPEFGRNRRLLALLESSGHELIPCHAELWHGPRYEIPNRRLVQTMYGAVVAYAMVIWRFLRAPRADLVLVLYPGWFDIAVLAPLARLRNMPILFDVFISVSDTVVSDRGLVPPDSVLARLLVLADRVSLRSARRVIADTPVDADFYAALAHMSRERVGVVWVGADDEVFRPRPSIAVDSNRVLFYGTFIRLHGIEYIVRAAKLLEDDDIEFRIIGTGQEEARVAALLAELRPSNVVRIEGVSREELADEIAAATVCLGIFGTSAKAGRVVPNKIFECASVGRPIITADTPGVRSAFREGELSMVAPGDPQALADEIRRLLNQPATRERIASAGHARYAANYTSECIAWDLEAQLKATTASRR